MQGDDETRDLKARLAELAEFSKDFVTSEGRLVHALHKELLTPGAGVWFQVAPGQAPELPEWPGEGEEDPLEEPFGHDADNIREVTREELDALRDGQNVAGRAHEPGDLTRTGHRGDVGPNEGDGDWELQRTFHDRHGRWTRIGDAPSQCGRVWILAFDHGEHVDSCANYDFSRVYRATLLRAIAEAYRTCRSWLPDCPHARVWLLYSFRGCLPDHEDGPLASVEFHLAVACVAE